MRVLKHRAGLATLLAAWIAIGCDGKGEPATPPCDAPAPLMGTPDPECPGIIVVLTEDVELEPEIDRLEREHGFDVDLVLGIINGFSISGEVPGSLIEDLRCEGSVESIGYDGCVTPG